MGKTERHSEKTALGFHSQRVARNKKFHTCPIPPPQIIFQIEMFHTHTSPNTGTASLVTVTGKKLIEIFLIKFLKKGLWCRPRVTLSESRVSDVTVKETEAEGTYQ